jgi:hypothetical protein
MVLLWALFGVIAGSYPELARGGSFLGIASGALAGLIVAPVLGLCIALLGGKVKPTLLGACVGMMLGVLVRFMAGAGAPLTADMGLLVGGMAGGTCPQVIRSTLSLARSVTGLGRAR